MKEDSKSGATRFVLGVDPGTGRLGWGLVSKAPRANSAELVECGVLETPAKTPLPERLEFIFKGLTDVVLKYKPTEFAIEELFFVKNVTTGMSVAHARGVAMLVAKLANLEIFEYSPNEVKVAITGYGRADKSQISKMLKLHLKGCNIKQDDTADAVAVALTHLQINRRQQ